MSKSSTGSLITGATSQVGTVLGVLDKDVDLIVIIQTAIDIGNEASQLLKINKELMIFNKSQVTLLGIVSDHGCRLLGKVWMGIEDNHLESLVSIIVAIGNCSGQSTAVGKYATSHQELEE